MLIAKRMLFLKSPDREEPVEILIYAPEMVEQAWICRYTIGWPGQPRSSFAAGIDSVQATHLMLQKIGMELYVSPYHLSGNLRWELAGDGYGFPVPKDGRDLLIGSDRTFDG